MLLFRFRKFISNKTIFFAICAVVSCLLMVKNDFSLRNTKESKRRPGDMVYILLWTRPHSKPSSVIKNAQETFMERRCPVTNCFVTSNKTLLSDVTAFDAILFYGPDLNSHLIPKKRSPHQKYVFVSNESSSYYPIYDESYDNFFNWTWTYKLKSDVYFGSIIIKNKRGDVIGPKLDMHWLDPAQMAPLNHEFRIKLCSKTKAAALIDLNCKSRRKGMELQKRIKKYLARYKLTLDIYGNCGKKHYPVVNMTDFLRRLETDYFFYLSFENSFSEDYVTEQVLHALQHYTVPIVFGGADYSRFLPPRSYLNAQNLTAITLVKRMVNIMKGGNYHEYFNWTNHYTYHHVQESPESDVYCNFCRKINEAKLVDRKCYYYSFRRWWNN